MTTALLLHFDGDNDSTTFTDVMGKTVTPYGNACLKTAVKKWGTASGYFDGSGDYLSVANHADFDFGSGDFTVEFWVNLASTASTFGLCSSSAAGCCSFLFYFSAGNIQFYASTDGSSWNVANAVIVKASPSTGTWYHIAAARDSGTIRLFCGGTLTNTVAVSGALVALGTNTPTIGQWAGGNYLNGYIDELQVNKGEALYTADFVPPTPGVIANGISSTTFGTPFASYPQFYNTPDGINSTTLGTPFAVYPQIGEASSLATTTFGEPAASQAFTATDINGYVAWSIRSTTFGTPTCPLRYTPDGINSTRFGTPTANVLNRTGRIADGINSTSFGTPTASLRSTCSAGSINSTAFGSPVAYWSQTGVIADGIHSTTFGIPAGPARAGRGKSIFITQRPR
jgi:hypothetical protein